MMSSQDRETAPPFASLDQAYAWLDSHINFEKNLDRVTSQSDSFKLDPIRGLLAALGSPHQGLNTIHIAGTRGKGSSALALEALLIVLGLRVATFTSPHIYEYRERLRIDGSPISADRFIGAIQRVDETLPSPTDDDSSFKTVFEILTATFFLAARDLGVDWVIVETGLGGRLDTTNVIDPGPVLLTRIGLEHTHILGDTPEAIASEKAAILKSGGWGVFNRQGYPAAETVFRKRAESVGAPLVRAEDLVACTKERYTPKGMELSFRFQGSPLDLQLPLYGPFLAENLQGVLAVASRLATEGRIQPLTPETIHEAWADLTLAGRMEPLPISTDRGIRLFIDGAHCPTGAFAVAAAMREHFGSGPATAVVGMMADKNHADFFAALASWPHWRRIICYGNTKLPRAASADRIAAAARPHFRDVQICPNIPTALQLALDQAEEREKIVALGSIFSVGTVSNWSRSYGRA